MGIMKKKPSEKRTKNKSMLRLSSANLISGFVVVPEADVGEYLERYKRSRGIAASERVVIKWK